MRSVPSSSCPLQYPAWFLPVEQSQPVVRAAIVHFLHVTGEAPGGRTQTHGPCRSRGPSPHHLHHSWAGIVAPLLSRRFKPLCILQPSGTALNLPGPCPAWTEGPAGHALGGRFSVWPGGPGGAGKAACVLTCPEEGDSRHSLL